MLRASLLIRLLVLVAVALLPAMGVLAYLQANLREVRMTRLGERAQHEAELLEADLGNIVGSAGELATAIAQFGTVQAFDPTCDGRLLALLSRLPTYAGLAVLNEAGTPVCAVGSETAIAAADGKARRALLQQALALDGTVAGLYMAGTGTATLPVARSFTGGEGTRRGIVIAALDLDWLSAHLQRLRTEPDSALLIADREGTVLARVPDRRKYVGQRLRPSGLAMLAADGAGVVRGPGVDGIDRLYGFVPAGNSAYGLFATVGLSQRSVARSVAHDLRAGYVLMALGALLSVILGLLLAQLSIRRPVAVLLAAARRWSAGDLSARASLPAGVGEFQRLALAFNGMVDSLGQHQRELHDLNATLELRVAKRTRDLLETNNRLHAEMSEREKAESSLRQAQKLQAVGQLAGGLAHEFNNLLTVVMGALELLRRRLDDQRLRGYADGALQAASRGARLTGQLLAFSRRKRLLPVPTDLNRVVSSMVELLSGTLGGNIRVETRLAGGLWLALVDPMELEAAILNLALNARDAMPNGGVLTIETGNATGGLVQGGGFGDRVMLLVADDGEGMNDETLARAVEPFFTTRPLGKGSGLGLSQVHGLAQQLGGELQVASVPGEGTQVSLLLPRAEAPELVFVPEPTVPLRRRRMLLVDDDAPVRQVTAEMLGELGFDVITAASGKEALMRLDEERFDLIVSDFSMPGMTGLELIGQVSRLWPEMQSMLITGYADFHDVDAAASLSPERVMRKPFTLSELAQRINVLLGRADARVSVPAGE